jgi:hypothetical protein
MTPRPHLRRQRMQLERRGEAHERHSPSDARRRPAHLLPGRTPRVACRLELGDARVGERRDGIVVLDQQGERRAHAARIGAAARRVDERHQASDGRARRTGTFR